MKYNDLRSGIKNALTLLAFFTLSIQVLAQDKTKAEEYVQQAEQYKRAALMRELDSGVYLMDNNDYAAAEVKFMYVLQNIKSVPSDLTYYFGKTSFHLGKYKQSIDWLNKYIQLKGTNGQFSEDAVQWKKKAEAEYLKEKSKEVEKAEEVLSTDYDIDCGPAGKVVCPVCKGDHVIIKKGAFGQEYKTCPYCDEHGILTCEEYNLLLRGQLKSKL
jgi:tetratricopeptide (TPR) repeat protein